MKIVHFTVPGEPTGKGRPRASVRNGRINMRTPEKTREYENLVQWCYAKAKGLYFDGEIAARITAYYAIPKAASKKKKAAMIKGEVRPTKKPDGDNVIKGVLDALNGLAYHDDSQVVHIEIDKYYSEEPRVEVELKGET